MYKNLYLKKGKEESLERFHPWIFSGAIHHIEGEPEEGEVVRVLTSEGDFIAVGHWQIGSIAVRVLDFEDKAVDGAYWEDRLRVAYDLRCAMKREMIPIVWCMAKETVCLGWWWMCMERQPSCRLIAWACTWRVTK